MAGEKIDLTRQTMKFLIMEMQKNDRLGIICFDSDVESLFTLENCTEKNKKEAITKVESILDRGQTNLSGGLYTGLELLRKRKEKNDISSILLFTDGEANEGLKTTKEITEMITGRIAHPEVGIKKGQESILQTFLRRKRAKKQMEEKKEGKVKKGYNYLSEGTTINTFGFGGDHNGDMLREISKTSSGIYYFIKTAEDISEAFVDCLGGLLSVVCKKLRVNLKSVGGSKIKKVHTVELPDLQSEERRDILIELELPKLDAENIKFKCLEVDLKYLDKDGNEKNEGLVGIVMRPKVEKKEEENEQISEQKNRIMATRRIDEVKKLADEGKYDDAKVRCKETINMIQQSRSGKSKFCKALIDDIQEQSEKLNRNDYHRGGGRSKFTCQQMGWGYQRSADVQSKSNKLFENKKRRNLKMKKSSYFKKK